ncbi:hypothetical protein B0T14DRAFT_333592 [Immersiella caudata]|uniref:Uncharacterized protein n=1 Tax=Immersiella caudata TaxID=314043 RepID=A0AA39U5V1_9PEZI|nr:hypothetical protein B0T14DRAFT_333592 [Immersiella caudata]
MAPFSFIPAILEQRQHVADAIYPGAMQCYAIPYSWPGFVGDVAAMYIALRIHHGRPPLPILHREIRYSRLRKWLATMQLLCCTILGICNCIRCYNFNPRQNGLILISIARTFVAAFNAFSLTNPSLPDSKSGNSGTPSPDSTARGDYLDPDAAVAAADVAQESREEENPGSPKAAPIPLPTKAFEQSTGPDTDYVVVPSSSQTREVIPLLTKAPEQPPEGSLDNTVPRFGQTRDGAPLTKVPKTGTPQDDAGASSSQTHDDPLMTQAPEQPMAPLPNTHVPSSSQTFDDPPPPYCAEPPETANDISPSAAANALNTLAADDAKAAELTPGAMVVMCLLPLVPLSLITAGMYPILHDVGVVGGRIGVDAHNTWIFFLLGLGFGVFFILFGFLVVACEAVFGKAPDDPEAAINERKKRLKNGCLLTLFVTAVIIVLLSNWGLEIAAGDHMPDKSRPDVFVLYWVFFVVSKLTLFAF